MSWSNSRLRSENRSIKAGSDYIPEEIIQNILVKLPIKSVIKCRQICKAWRSLIQSSIFIRTHLKQQSDVVFMDGKSDCALYSLPQFSKYTELSDPLTNISTTIFSPRQQELVSSRYVVGTCDGLLCLAIEFRNYGSTAVVWNPCVKKFITLPCPRVGERDYRSWCVLGYAFGSDSIANDYKVLRTVTPFRDPCGICEVEVFSVAKGLWKSISTHDIPTNFVREVDIHRYALVNGALHWLWYRSQDGDRDSSIVLFDMASESFGEIIMPQDMRRKSCFILRHNESIALFNTTYLGSSRSSSVDMWVMKDYGKVESWTKVLTISLQGFIIRPFACLTTGEVVVEIFRGMVVSVHPTTKQIKDLGINWSKYNFIDSFVESLVFLGQSNAISY